ncbi:MULTISPECIES: porin family protein [unclassified Chitinophaga]|uniref:porin family protein n=1 Tax=unclassified Chitinophaga TaxID=2619133 RepID=UPI0009C5520E|nr:MULTISPECIES: porin family protein [unclassified Chitinophaga]OMP79947.1 hypothetical protein BW716_06945 [[Flexibacter] sp. ATCC 35208]WPV64110.1 porin family protein [Chitinophaga sp. LS1]
MKKGLLLAGVLSLFIGTASKAQTFHYGLKASLMFSSIQGDGMQSGVKPGFQGGLYAQWDLSKDGKWGFQPELLFTQAAAKKASSFPTYFVSDRNTYGNDKLRLSYVTVPLLLRYSPVKNFTLLAGGQYSYLVYADENIFKGNRDALTKSDIGAVAGVQIAVSTVHFFGRYVYGINDVLNVHPADRGDVHWHSQQITVGMGINIK